MINGIPVKVLTENDKGDLAEIETAVFATVRKCPKLKGLMKAFAKAQIAVARAEIEAQRAQSAMLEAENLDEAAAEAEKLSEKVVDASEQLCKAMVDFVVAGFVGAGIPKEEAERLASYIDVEQFEVLQQKCLTGAGVADFSRPGS